MIPFKYHDSSVDPDPNNCNRLKVYQRFMANKWLDGKTLDIGEPGYISNYLAVTHNTLPCDFNFEIKAPSDNYETITCFEVINHVPNMATFVQNLSKLLSPDGTIYLSAPCPFLITWHHCKYNFAMLDPKRLRQVFEYYGGLKVVRIKKVNPWPWWFMFYGVRPFFRVLFNRIALYELKKDV